MTRRHARKPVRAIFAMPALLAAMTALALVAGLVGDGLWDLVAWAGLAVPILAAWPAFAPRRKAPPRHTAPRPLSTRPAAALR